MRQDITVAIAPHISLSDRKSLLYELEALASELDSPPVPRQPMAQMGNDPEQARAWFASQGVKVESA